MVMSSDLEALAGSLLVGKVSKHPRLYIIYQTDYYSEFLLT